MLKIGIILSSTRDDLKAEILDLRDYPLPFFNEVASSLWAPSQNEVAQHWQKKVVEFDGFIFITAEYNRSLPAALKNALDYAYTEWNRKPTAYFGYGSVGGARAIEHLRLINIEQQMAPMRNGVHLQGADFFGVMQGELFLEDLPYVQSGTKAMLDELTWWGQALKVAREKA